MADRRPYPGRTEGLGQPGAAAPDHQVVLDGDHQLVLGGQFEQRRIDRQRPDRIDHGDADPLVGQPVGHPECRPGQLSVADHQHPRRDPALLTLAQHVDPADLVHRVDVLGQLLFAVTDHARGVVDLHRTRQRLAEPGAVPRRAQVQPRNQLQHRHVPHAVVAGAVVAGDAGAIEHEGDPAAVQGHVHQHLVEGPVQEGGVDGEHRMQARHRHPRRRGHRVLLGDPDVERPLGEGGGEPVQTGGVGHRRGDGHDPVVGPAEPHQLLGEHVGPGRPLADRQRQTGHLVDLADGVELVLLVVLGRREPLALAGQDMHHHRAAELLGVLQGTFDGEHIVPVDRPDVLDPQIGVHPLRGQHVLESGLDPVQHLIGRRPDQRRPVDLPLDHVEHLLVARVGPQPAQMPGQPADRRGVGASVVVDHDHQRQITVGRDVVQRLPGHSAGERAVADHRDHRVPVPTQPERLRHPLGPGQGRRGVLVLDPVVFGFGPARIPRQPVLLFQGGKTLLSTGEDLVDVALVTGVEDDRVGR